MHINMKYYIVTIGAIFIALGIGILVGFNLNYDQELSKQQSQIVKDLDNQFAQLSDKNDKLKEDLSKSQKEYKDIVSYLNKHYSVITKDVIKDKKVGIITTSQNYNYNDDILSTLNNGGAKIAFDIVINSKAKDKDVIESLAKEVNVELKSEEDVMNYVAETLKGDNAKDTLEKLQKLEVIKVNSLSDEYKNIDSLVLATGSSDEKDLDAKFNNIDKALADSFKNSYVIAVEKNNVKQSYIEKYKNHKVSTIDNVNDGSGRISLVTAIKYQSKGHFGTKEKVDSLIPLSQ